MEQSRSLLIFAAFVVVLSAATATAFAFPSNQQQVFSNNNRNNNQVNNLPQESGRERIVEDDLTAADLDLDGAAATDHSLEREDIDRDDSDADSMDSDASGNDSRWLDQYGDQGDDNEPSGQDSNIENAKIYMNSKDMATAAGHHHHHGHYPHGWLKMGAETGKKGAFKWHDKHPVGGKGRR